MRRLALCRYLTVTGDDSRRSSGTALLHAYNVQKAAVRTFAIGRTLCQQASFVGRLV